MSVPSRRSVLVGAMVAGVGVAYAAPAASHEGRSRDGLEPLTTLEREEPRRLTALVTKRRSIEPPRYVPPDLVTWKRTDHQVLAEVAEHLDAMFTAASRLDLRLRVTSGFRSYDTQRETHRYWAARNGRAAADASSARAGHSEHQTGLAVDLDVRGQGQRCRLKPCFGATREGRWIAANAYRYGFLQSYPRGYRDRTGYVYEPWHLRYVGPRVAGDMHRRGVVLLQDYLREADRWEGPARRLGAPVAR